MAIKCKNNFRAIIFCFGGFLAAGFSQFFSTGAEEVRVLRFPAIYKELVVFSYAGDLYSVPAAAVWPEGLLPIPDMRLLLDFHRMESISPLPENMTEIEKFT